MYREHFYLKELPFSIAPNPRYLYLTHQHQEALAHLIYGLNSAGGVILLTGEVGTGKTTLSRKLLENIPDNIDIAWIVNPRLSVEELLAAICDELMINYPKGNCSIKIFTDLISNRLIQAHGRNHNVVLIIDEAQNLSPEVLEQLRLLTNLETSERKLLQIVLLGQPELKTMLERSDLRQLAQRITARYHLHELSRTETGKYIHHRLAVGGCDRPVFSPRAIKLIHRISHGTPRLINLICDRAMLGVYSAGGSMVYPKHVRQASLEVLGKTDVLKRPLFIPVSIALLLMAGGIFATGAWKQLATEERPRAVELKLAVPPSQTLEVKTESQAINAASTEPIPSTPELAQAPNPEPFNETPPETESATGVQMETPPTQPTEVAPSLRNNTVRNITIARTQSKEIITEPAKKDISASPSVAEKDMTIPQPQDTPWNVIEKTGSKILAFETLADIWHSSITSKSGDPCNQLTDSNLACLEQNANIWLIRQINRPTIFQFTGQDHASHYGVIRFISHGHAVIQLGQQQWRVTLSELKQYMQDQIFIIWNKPPGYQSDIQLGDSGKAVEWLARQLDHIQGTMIPPRHFHSLDEILMERLKDFQKSEGIPPDGIAGTMTITRINERIGLDIPRLKQEKKR